jgi:nucleoside-diphosphate-sugar epimerase
VFASSADVYGPWSEEPVREETEPRPATPYAIAKLEAERLVADACRHSQGAVSVRLSTVFGPTEHRARAVPAFVRALARGERPVVHGDGGDVRDYAFVDDVARAIVRCALDPLAFAAAGPLVNLGSGTGRTTLDVLHAVGDALGVDPAPVHVPSERQPSRLVVDASRARRVLGFANRTSFEDGLRLEAALELAEVA